MPALPAQRNTRNKIFTPLGDLLPSQSLVTFISELLKMGSPVHGSFGVVWEWGRVSFIHELQTTLPLECSPRAGFCPDVALLDEEESASCISSQKRVKNGAAKTSCWVQAASWDCGVFGEFPVLPPPGRTRWHRKCIIYSDYRERHVHNIDY